MTFAAYISCFCVEFSFDLVTFTFNLLTLAMSDELSFTYVQCTYMFSILLSSVSELCVTQSDHMTFTWNGHCAHAVSLDLSRGGRGAKMIHIFWNPWTQFTYSLCHFYGAKTKI